MAAAQVKVPAVLAIRFVIVCRPARGGRPARTWLWAAGTLGGVAGHTVAIGLGTWLGFGLGRRAGHTNVGAQLRRW